MKYLTTNRFVQVDGEIWEVNTGNKQQYEICPKHMKQIIRQLTVMCSHHQRVMVVFFDLKVSSYTDDNKLMSDFIREVRKITQSDRYKMTRFGYCWAREMEKAKQQHYHVALFLDGKRIRYPHKILDLLSNAWLKIGGAHLYTPKNCYYDIKGNDFQAKQQAIYRLSYQAKARGKGYRAKQAKDYGTSRLRIKYGKREPESVKTQFSEVTLPSIT
ncbi:MULTISPECIES: YagK/YfjJ domain-containing protein [Vibrio]|nr:MULTISPECIES: inovirus-type Gp2 protein [Vibrio]MDW3056619.1 inovirus-type Gp2 protein [Vibrio sp. 1978]TOB76028.1 inovirus Gp2 family protein [Vibrio parahaemolyticus]TON85491.1 inovirus Gp2 family protein [Vibrio parahaemolyticus]